VLDVHRNRLQGAFLSVVVDLLQCKSQTSSTVSFSVMIIQSGCVVDKSLNKLIHKKPDMSFVTISYDIRVCECLLVYSIREL
jgi:hypothetical protein